MFPFEETQDQLLAIEATKADMESSRIMDRLICGEDVYKRQQFFHKRADSEDNSGEL